MRRPTRRFALRLALALGRCDVSQLLGEMTAGELAEWQAFYMLEPFGTEADDFRAALIASVIAETHRDTKRRRRPYTPADFMPRRGPDVGGVTLRSMLERRRRGG